MLELVDELEKRGYLTRESDPTDRRAKLVCLTPGGRTAMRDTRAIIAKMERDYAEIVGPDRYELMCEVLQKLGSSPWRE